MIRYLIKVITGCHTLCVEEPEDLPQERAFTQFFPVSQCNNYSIVVLSVEDKYLMTFDRHFRLYLFYPHLWFRLSSFLSCFITKGEKLLPGRFAGSNKAFNPLAPDLVAVAIGVIPLSDFFLYFFNTSGPSEAVLHRQFRMVGSLNKPEYERSNQMQKAVFNCMFVFYIPTFPSSVSTYRNSLWPPGPSEGNEQPVAKCLYPWVCCH